MTVEELLASAPIFFRSDIPPCPFSERGVEIRPGWFPLAARMAQRIEALMTTGIIRDKTYCIQIKQKLGELRCYVAAYSLIREDVRKIVNESRLESLRTCEYCGEEGKPRKNKYGFMFVGCDKHEEKWSEAGTF